MIPRLKALFLALAPRHKAIALLLGAALAFLALSLLARAAGAQTVSEYLRNPALLDRRLAECEDDPGGFGRSRACVNANSAGLARLRDRLAGQHRRRTVPAPSPVLPAGPEIPAVRRYRL